MVTASFNIFPLLTIKKIKKLIDSDLSSIAIAQFSASNQSNEGIKQILSESYQITTIPLSSAVPADVGVMIINGVSDSLTADELKNVKDFIDIGDPGF